MTTTEIEALGTLVLARYGMTTHVTVLMPWQPEIDRMRARYQAACDIAAMWKQEEASAGWNSRTDHMISAVEN